MRILSDVLPSSDIYEFDYQSYFDKVPVFDVTAQLNAWGVPRDLTDLLRF